MHFRGAGGQRLPWKAGLDERESYPRVTRKVCELRGE